MAAEADQLDLTYKDLFRKPSPSSLALTAEGQLRDLSDLNLTTAALRTTLGVFNVRGRLNDLPGTPEWDIDVENTSIALDRLTPLVPSLAPYQIQGNAALNTRLDGTTAKAAVQGQLSISKAALLPIPGVPLKDLSGRIFFSNDQARVDALTGTAFGAPFTLSARLDHFDRPALYLEGDWARLPVDKVLRVFASTPTAPATKTATASSEPAPLARADGVFRISEITHPHYLGRQFVFRWNLTDLGPNLSVLSGSATVTAAEGEIRNVPVASKINKLLNRNRSEITYKKLTGTFLVTRGSVNIRPLLMDSDQTDFRAEGTVRLGNMDSDLRLLLKLPPGSVPGSVGEWMTAEDGRPTIEATLKGPLADPTVKVNRKDIVRRAAQDILKKTLGGWKGKPDPQPTKDEFPASHPPRSSSDPRNPLKDAEKALKNIWKN